MFILCAVLAPIRRGGPGPGPDPEGFSSISEGVEEGGPPPTPSLSQTQGFDAPGGQPLGCPEGEGEGGGGVRRVPQHTELNMIPMIILNRYKWGKNFFKKKFAYQLRLPSAKGRHGGRVGVKMFYCVFLPIFEFFTKF